MTLEATKCPTCGIDPVQMKAERHLMLSLLIEVNKAFDPDSKAGWQTQSALRQRALTAIDNLIKREKA